MAGLGKAAIQAHVMDALRFFSKEEQPDGSFKKKYWADELYETTPDGNVVLTLTIPGIDLALWIEANHGTCCDHIKDVEEWKREIAAKTALEIE